MKKQADNFDVSKMMHQLGFRTHSYEKTEKGTWQTTHYGMNLDKYVVWASFDRPNAVNKTHRLMVKVIDNGKFVCGAYKVVSKNKWAFHTISNKSSNIVVNKGIYLASNWKTRMIQVMANVCNAITLRDKSKEIKSFADKLNIAKAFV